MQLCSPHLARLSSIMTRISGAALRCSNGPRLAHPIAVHDSPWSSGWGKKSRVSEKPYNNQLLLNSTLGKN